MCERERERKRERERDRQKSAHSHFDTHIHPHTDRICADGVKEEVEVEAVDNGLWVWPWARGRVLDRVLERVGEAAVAAVRKHEHIQRPQSP